MPDSFRRMKQQEEQGGMSITTIVKEEYWLRYIQGSSSYSEKGTGNVDADATFMYATLSGPKSVRIMANFLR